MPVLNTATTLNGLYFDQTSIRFSPAGISMTEHLIDLSFDDAIKPTEIRGTSPVKLGSGLGTYDANMMFQILEDVWGGPNGFAAQIAAKSISGKDLTTVIFPAAISFVSVTGRIHTIDIPYVRIVGRKFGGKNNAAGYVREIPCFVREIIEDGVRLVPQILG